MTKVVKRLSSMLLAVAMVATMIPFVAAPVLAEDTVAFTLYVNGVSTDKTITKEWLEENSLDAQVFPFASQQGKAWGYTVAEGPSIEAVFVEALGISSLDDLEDVAINWNNEAGAEQGKFDLNVSDINDLTSCFKLVDQNGNDVTGPFNGSTYTDVSVAELDGAADVTPIIAVKYHEYGNYTDAKDALDEGTWETGAETDTVRPYVGGTLNKEQYLKKGGEIKMGVVNFTGKYAIEKEPQLNLKMPTSLEIGAMKFTSTAAKQAKMPFSLTDAEIDLLYGVATWTSSDETVATVDTDTGLITPAGKIGTCVVTAKMSKGNVIGKCNVTVDKAAFAPAVPGSFKVKNVKKKTAQLSWKAASKATGYEIYRSTKKTKGFKKVKTLTGTSYKNKKLKKGKTYYFKVRSYRDYNGTRLYSNYTSVKKIKIKK